jgi:glycosyltransferase involved in cell wall biosynthesis
MGVQYLSMAYGQCGKWLESKQAAMNGLELDPGRAEFWNCIGDAYLKLQKPDAAQIFYSSAKKCSPNALGGAIYTSPTALKEYPAHQLAQIHLSRGDWQSALGEAEVLESCKHPAANEFKAKAEQIRKASIVPRGTDLVETDDIVISTPPNVVTSDWDELVLKQKGMGGSETACIEVARLLKKKTGRNVKVFMKRKSSDFMPSGVEYHPIDKLEGYFRRYKPAAHIAWRHSVKLTEAPTYVWSHDLVTPGGQFQDNYTKYWCLTEFHKHFVMDMQGVSEDKIDVISNGIDPELFKEVQGVPKNPTKVFFSSSPDRGWERAIEICKRARNQVPELELHLFYGTGNMRKMGMEAEADRLDQMVKDNDFVKYHGFVGKKELVRHIRESAVWLYPADFIETSCITAMEALCAGTWPLVRNMGALKYTLGEAIKKDMCRVLDIDACDDETYSQWSTYLVDAIQNELWKKVDVSLDDYSWEKATKGIVESMGL